jgi:hypothetical protein
LVSDAFGAAKGGTLFLDEAPSLVDDGDSRNPSSSSGRGGSGRDAFARDAVATLLTEVENNRTSVMVVLAGYATPMERLLDADPGLRRRFPSFLNLPDYTPTELAAIAEKVRSMSPYMTCVCVCVLCALCACVLACILKKCEGIRLPFAPDFICTSSAFSIYLDPPFSCSIFFRLKAARERFSLTLGPGVQAALALSFTPDDGASFNGKRSGFGGAGGKNHGDGGGDGAGEVAWLGKYASEVKHANASLPLRLVEHALSAMAERVVEEAEEEEEEMMAAVMVERAGQGEAPSAQQGEDGLVVVAGSDGVYDLGATAAASAAAEEDLTTLHLVDFGLIGS